MARVAEKDRLRSITLGGTETLASAVTFDGVLDTFVFQDDVKIVAIELGIEFLAIDAHSNGDGHINGIVELSRQAGRSLPGSMGRVEVHAVWNAAIVIGGPTRHMIYLPFPGPTGWEFDEGEGVNLLAFFTWIGAGGVLPAFGEAIVFYVER